MANKIRTLGGMRPAGSLRAANIYQSAGAIYPGDLLQLDSNGNVVAAAAGAIPCVGVALSYAGAANVDVLVADSPAQQFVIEAASAGVTSQTSMNLNYNIKSGSPSSAYKLSNVLLDDSSGSSTPSTSGALQLKALRLEKRDDNAFGANADVVVIINNHALSGSGQAGV